MLASLATRVTRMGVVLEPNGDLSEVEGVLNPGAARSRSGTLLLYPRMVGAGNCSCVGMVEVNGAFDAPVYQRIGMALRPEATYELRDARDGQGCEDPRITFVAVLDLYVMAYTAFGPAGPRIALAVSPDGYAWERLGLVDFSATGLPDGHDKDAAFFPEPVRSPAGVLSFAMYHRPMTHSTPSFFEEIRIAYVPLEAALATRTNLLKVAESVTIGKGAGDWGLMKNGAGTPPVRIAEGLLSVFHGVDQIVDADGTSHGRRYSAGIIVHDAEQPHLIRYRSSIPILVPYTVDERNGIVNDVVFPTGIDIHSSLTPRSYDVYYGMADARVGRVRLELDPSTLEAVA
jgi:beta-1,2-mannobiose phosphorylase / 1,2-beta-oligomannan phosphorylase